MQSNESWAADPSTKNLDDHYFKMLISLNFTSGWNLQNKGYHNGYENQISNFNSLFREGMRCALQLNCFKTSNIPSWYGF